MSSFVALNIEPESDSEDEIDDSKEIQIEEALKLYQTALKLHSQGPNYYTAADEAYQALFKSEVFTYPESISLSKQIDLYGDVDNFNDSSAALNEGVIELPVSGAEEASNTLQQILYLANKNRGLFLLDQLKHHLRNVRNNKTLDDETLRNEIHKTVWTSLSFLVEAVDRDEDDLHLWRLISRLSYFLKSKRVARFCLEAVLDDDEAQDDSWPDSLGLEESYATEQLRTLLDELEDDISISQASKQYANKHRLLPSLQKHVDPLLFLASLPPELTREDSQSRTVDDGLKQEEIVVPFRDWATVGKAILVQANNVTQGAVESPPGTAYVVRLPERQASPVVNKSEQPLIIDTATKHITATEVAPYRASSETVGNEVREETSVTRMTNQPQEPISVSPLEERSVAMDISVEDPDKEPPTPADETAKTEPGESMIVDNDLAGEPEPLVLESPRTMSLPTRKRSSEAAGLQEAADLGRSKSKRIKARVSVNDNAAEDLAQYYEDQLREYTQADQYLFDFVGNLLSKVDAKLMGSFTGLKTIFTASSSDPIPREKSDDPLTAAIQDFKAALNSWSLEKSNMFLKSPNLSDSFGGATGAQNFTAFLENSKRGPSQTSDLPALLGDDGLENFSKKTLDERLLLDQLTLSWVEGLLAPKTSTRKDESDIPSAYERFLWIPALKDTVVQVLTKRDEYIFNTLCNRAHELDKPLLKSLCQQRPIHWMSSYERLAKLIQNIFEMHIDVYERINNPSSVVEPEVRSMQRHRLGRWAALAHHVMDSRPGDVQNPDVVQIRFFWATVLFIHLTETSAQDHIILCFQDLKRILSASEARAFRLQNNAAMPEISVEAAEREISCLTTMDFFLGIFHSENDEPTSVIESLEPMLQRSVAQSMDATPKATSNQSTETLVDGDSPSIEPVSNDEDMSLSDPGTEDMVQYFNKASLTLRLFLWQRLEKAYKAIDYPPQVLCCSFRRMELIVRHLQTAEYLDQPSQVRQLNLLKWLKELDHVVSMTLDIVMTTEDPFEVLDLVQLRSSMASLSALQKVIHIYILWTDSVRVGQTTILQPPRGSSATQFGQSMAKFNQLQVRIWMLQFMLLKEATVQAPELFEAPQDGLIDYLNLVHYTLGLRELCGLCNRSFLKLLKNEMLAYRASNKASQTWEWDFAQVIFDLYGLKICPSFFKIGSHGCPSEQVDRATALELMDYVLIQANRLGVKDVAKSELKLTIDKMQAAIKAPKPSKITTFNKRAITYFLRASINPLDMYRALKGLGELTCLTVHNDFVKVADKGWYSLLGQMSLVKFRSQKRTIPGPLDDLDIAMTFFKHDLELGMEKWETWYRLAQVYDTKIEENTTWNAEKINNGMEELKLLQRSAIHCYTMAVATAMRSADASFEGIGKIADLHADFAIRIYASSREPFSMKAFGLQDFERHFNDPVNGMYKKRPFRDMQLYSAWNFARVLLQRALTDKPNSWISWYMLGKCLWKMYNCSPEVRGNAARPDYEKILHALERAIATVPDRRDSRHPEKEPILEPHYKLVSIIHKLVQKGTLQVSEACSHLKATSYAQKVSPVGDREDWEMYISQVLKSLRAADKSNWHHRMVARAAHAIYDDSPDDDRSALGAKHELTQQMFTKTMAIQVWRPDNERAGRHFVYTSRYVKFFVRLLFQLDDKTSLEALAKRVRKRSADFLAHPEIWQEVCMTYLELLRRQGPVPILDENTIFNGITYEVFTLNADRLEAHLSDTTSPLLDIIKDTIELKKTNQNLMKVTTIEDLTVDTYTMLYEQTVPDLIAKSNDEENRVRMRVDHVLMAPEDSATATPPPDPNARPGEPLAPKRLKNVTRREVIRRAEALIAKPAAAILDAKVAKSTDHATEQEGTSRIAVVIQNDISKDAGSSAAGSVHDSADDESELSELDEFVGAPEKPSTFFPNLSKDEEGGGDTEVDEGEGDNDDRPNEEEGPEDEEELIEKDEDENSFQSVAPPDKELDDREVAETQAREE